MDPIDYSSVFNNVQSPQDAILSGYKTFLGISELQAARAKQQADLAQQKQQRQVVIDLVNNKDATADDYAKATLLVPALHEQFKQAWDAKSGAQQQADLKNITLWSSAIQSGQPKIASDGMRQQADAIENTEGGPTPQSKALRQKADTVDANPAAANVVLKSMLFAHPDGKKVIDNIVALGKENRDVAKAPAELRTANAKASEAEADTAQKEDAVIGSAAGALVGKGATIGQVTTMLKAQAAKGLISKDNVQAYIDAIPTDPKVRDQWLGTFQMGGLKPEEQVKLTTPDANSRLSAQTQLTTTSMNNRTQLAVQDRIDSRAAKDTAGDDDGVPLTKDAIDNAAARYNVDGTLPPVGAGAAAAVKRNQILNRAADLKKGVDPEQQRRDQLANKGTAVAINKAVNDFSTGKNGNAVRSFNVGLAHLDTLDQLATALDNKDTRLFNKIGNAVATQTGSAAPTSFNAAKKIVGDEIVKAVVGGGGGGVHDREEVAKTIDAASSPAQLKAVIKTYKELMVGQLGGLEQQYKVTTKRDDFDRFLSPEAIKVRGNHAPKTPAAASAPALPSGWTVKEH